MTLNKYDIRDFEELAVHVKQMQGIVDGMQTRMKYRGDIEADMRESLANIHIKLSKLKQEFDWFLKHNKSITTI